MDEISEIINKIDQKLEEYKGKTKLEDLIVRLKRNSPRWIMYNFFELSFRGQKNKVREALNLLLETKIEYFELEDRIKLYKCIKEILKQEIQKEEYFSEFFNDQKAIHYQKRMEELFTENKRIVIEKEIYEKVMKKFENMFLTTLKIGLEIEEEEKWIENFKKAIEIHEICEETHIDLYERIKEEWVKKHHIPLSFEIQLINLYQSWYHEKKHTFAAENKPGYNMIDYLYKLRSYSYLIDEKHKEKIRETLPRFSLEEIEEEYNIQWVKDQIKKYI